MRRICIYHKDGRKIEVYDESDNPLDEFCTDLSKLLVFNNVTILKTSTSTTILRPSQIQSIHVSEVTTPEKEKIPESKVEISDNEMGLETEEPKIIEDTITDK